MNCLCHLRLNKSPPAEDEIVETVDESNELFVPPALEPVSPVKEENFEAVDESKEAFVPPALTPVSPAEEDIVTVDESKAVTPAQEPFTPIEEVIMDAVNMDQDSLDINVDETEKGVLTDSDNKELPSTAKCSSVKPSFIFNECSKYAVCVNGKYLIQECAPGTVFDPKSQNCAFETDRFDCKDVKPMREQETKTQKQDDSASSETNVSSNNLNINLYFVPSEAGFSATSCDFIGLLGMPNDCLGYVVCENGTPIATKCPPGAVFDPTVSLLTCIHPVNALRSDCKV